MSNDYAQPSKDRPEKITLIAVLSLINGIVNIFWGIGVTVGTASTIIGLCCVPITILPIILGGFEIAYAAKLFSNPPIPTKSNTTIAILDIICILMGNFISLVVGILLLVFYNDLEVVDWFKSLAPEQEQTPKEALVIE